MNIAPLSILKILKELKNRNASKLLKETIISVVNNVDPIKLLLKKKQKMEIKHQNQKKPKNVDININMMISFHLNMNSANNNVNIKRLKQLIKNQKM